MSTGCFCDSQLYKSLPLRAHNLANCDSETITDCETSTM